MAQLCTDKTSVDLTEDELRLIIAALEAVSPCGGGSNQFSLMCKLRKTFDLEIEPEEVGRLQVIAHREVEDALDTWDEED